MFVFGKSVATREGSERRISAEQGLSGRVLGMEKQGRGEEWLCAARREGGALYVM